METVTFQSTASLETPVHFVGPCISVPKSYIICSQDSILPCEAQASMVQALGKNTTAESIKSDHIPFLISGVRQQLFDRLAKAALM